MDGIIRDKLIEKILAGEYTWGEKIPSEHSLCEEFQVPRITVRKALLSLEEMGYIFSRQGKGRFLRQRQSIIPLNLNGVQSFTEKIRQAGLPLETSTISYRMVTPSSKITKQLQAREEEAVFRIERLRILDGTPIAIHISYLREKLFPDLAEKGDRIESLFQYFRTKGYENFLSTKSIISVSLPTLEEQNQLACPPLVPLLVLESDTLDEHSLKPLQHTRILYRCDSFQYEIG